MYNGSTYCAVEGQEYMSTMHPAIYQDFGISFTCKYVTESWNGETMNWKTCSRVILDCDRHGSSGTSNVQLSWSDKDWADGGVTARNINIFSESPFLVNTGRFRKRSYKIEYADNYPIRFYGLSMRLNYMGN